MIDTDVKEHRIRTLGYYHQPSIRLLKHVGKLYITMELPEVDFEEEVRWRKDIFYHYIDYFFISVGGFRMEKNYMDLVEKKEYLDSEFSKSIPKMSITREFDSHLFDKFFYTWQNRDLTIKFTDSLDLLEKSNGDFVNQRHDIKCKISTLNNVYTTNEVSKPNEYLFSEYEEVYSTRFYLDFIETTTNFYIVSTELVDSFEFTIEDGEVLKPETISFQKQKYKYKYAIQLFKDKKYDWQRIQVLPNYIKMRFKIDTKGEVRCFSENLNIIRTVHGLRGKFLY